jgi:predicted Zn-dependent peptidase
MNGTTSTERTNYFETLPSNYLPLAFWLESDRMRSLKVTQENLDNQRHAVQEEKRLRMTTSHTSMRFCDERVDLHESANAHSTIGSMEDLDAATIDDVREFFRIYYAPNNAVLSVVGDFDTAKHARLVDKYFGSIPSQPLPPPVDVSNRKTSRASGRDVSRSLAPAPAFVLGWKVPQRRTPDFYALSLAGTLLFEGDSSRLYQKLVKGRRIGRFDRRRRGRTPWTIALYIFALPNRARK